MNKQELLERLRALQSLDDTEMVHREADDLIMSFLRAEGHDDIAYEFERLDKWYA